MWILSAYVGVLRLWADEHLLLCVRFFRFYFILQELNPEILAPFFSLVLHFLKFSVIGKACDWYFITELAMDSFSLVVNVYAYLQSACALKVSGLNYSKYLSFSFTRMLGWLLNWLKGIFYRDYLIFFLEPFFESLLLDSSIPELFDFSIFLKSYVPPIGL